METKNKKDKTKSKKSDNVEKGEPSVNDDDDYNPYLHREVKVPTNNIETFIHMMKGGIGTGILAMPEAFLFSGIWTGLFSTILIGILCTYCLHMLINAQYVMCKRYKIPLLTYPESMKLACQIGPKCMQNGAKFMPTVVNVFLLLYQMGICCVYIVFVASNVMFVVNQHIAHPWRIEYYILCAFLPFFLILCVRNLKILAPFSMFANVVTFVSFGVILYYIFLDLPNLNERPFFGSFYTYPLFVGTTLFALEAVGVVITLENNMKTPQSFTGWFGVLNWAMLFTTLIYILLGFMGYWRYGDKTQSSITLNLPEKEWLTKSVNIGYAVAIFITYSLQGIVPVQIMWNDYLHKYIKDGKNELLWEYVLRFVIVFLTFVFAISIPLLGLFISLCGSFCLSALGIAFPAIIQMCAHWNDFGCGKHMLIKNIFLIILSVLALCAGSYSAVSEIVKELSKMYSS